MTEIDSSVSRPVPKIELHVHLEGTIRVHTLMTVARRNGLPLPADTVEGLADLYRFRDFRHFLAVWALTTSCLHTSPRDYDREPRRSLATLRHSTRPLHGGCPRRDP